MRFRHKTFGTVVHHDDPDWLTKHPQYEPVPPKTARKLPTLDDVTKAELVTEARRRGLPTSGNKADLIKRLSP